MPSTIRFIQRQWTAIYSNTFFLQANISHMHEHDENGLQGICIFMINQNCIYFHLCAWHNCSLLYKPIILNKLKLFLQNIFRTIQQESYLIFLQPKWAYILMWTARTRIGMLEFSKLDSLWMCWFFLFQTHIGPFTVWRLFGSEICSVHKSVLVSIFSAFGTSTLHIGCHSFDYHGRGTCWKRSSYVYVYKVGFQLKIKENCVRDEKYCFTCVRQWWSYIYKNQFNRIQYRRVREQSIPTNWGPAWKFCKCASETIVLQILTWYPTYNIKFWIP